MTPAVFLDRDNTLIDDMGYTADPERVALRAGAGAAIRRLHEAGLAVVVVTNQSGVARGLFSEEELSHAHERMQQLLRREGAGVDAVYYCPFMPGADAVIEHYRRDSSLRKPRPGMLFQAARELALDLPRSWMIGDALRDVEAGRAAGCRTILLSDGSAVRPGAADFTAPDLPTAVDLILSQSGPARAAPTDSTGGTSPTSTPSSHSAGRLSDAAQSDDGQMRELLAEVRQWRRELRQRDFSAAHFGGYLVQVLAAGALIWGVFGLVEEHATSGISAEKRLLAAVGLQLLALTALRAKR